MRIHFQFNLEKAVQAMGYIVARIGDVEKVKLMKLMYIADRNHFVRHGHPITGSTLVAMDYGPLPSACLDVIDGEYRPDENAAFDMLRVDNYTVSLCAPLVTDRLSEQEKATLDLVIKSYGSTPKWELVDYTHKFPEYKEVFVEGTSRPITYENILKHYKGEDGFRHGRPVISEKTLQHMTFPFTAANDSDL